MGVGCKIQHREQEIDMYTYNAKVISVYDGDTIRVDIDLGFGVWLKKQSIRLRGIDAPEIRGESREAGIRARDRLRELLMENMNKCVIETYKYNDRGKYGRIIGEIFINEIDRDSIKGSMRSANKILLHENLVEEYVE